MSDAPTVNPSPIPTTIELAGVFGYGQEQLAYPPSVKRNLCWLNQIDTLSNRPDIIEAAVTRDRVRQVATLKRAAINGPAIIGAEVEPLLPYFTPALFWDKEYMTVRSAKIEAVVEGLRLACQPGDKVCLYKTLLFPWEPWNVPHHRRREMLFAQYNRTLAQRFVEATDIVILEFYADSRRSDAETADWIGDVVGECRSDLTGDKPLLAAFWDQYRPDDPQAPRMVTRENRDAHRRAAQFAGCEYMSHFGGLAPSGPTVAEWNAVIAAGAAQTGTIP